MQYIIGFGALCGVHQAECATDPNAHPGPLIRRSPVASSPVAGRRLGLSHSSVYYVPRLVGACSSTSPRRPRPGSITSSVDELIAAITRYIDRRSEHPTPFVWTATTRQILAKVNKVNKTLATLH